MSVETCPHYLNFVSEEVPRGDTSFKCAPPLRGAANREALWRGLAEGVVDSVASDHSPSPLDMKMLDEGDFSRAWGGIACEHPPLILLQTPTATLREPCPALDRLPLPSGPGSGCYACPFPPRSVFLQ